MSQRDGTASSATLRRRRWTKCATPIPPPINAAPPRANFSQVLRTISGPPSRIPCTRRRREILLVFTRFSIPLIRIRRRHPLPGDVRPLRSIGGVQLAPEIDACLRVRQDCLGRALGLANAAVDALVRIDGEHLLVVADPVKGTAASAVRALTHDGVRVIMLTGDNRGTADAVARQVGGIDEVIADVLPDQKQAVVERLRAAGARVAMAGDGINDAPALAAADVGIAMGTGTDVAMESAAVTLVKGDLTGIVRARRLSRAVMRNIRQNLFFAFIFNALAVPIAAGVLYPLFAILLSPIIAGAAMALSSVTVISNALRLRRVKLT